MKTKRASRPRQIPAVDAPLTIHDARNPAMPWLPPVDAADDFEDRRYATEWARAHPPVETIGAIQKAAAPSPTVRVAKQTPVGWDVVALELGGYEPPRFADLAGLPGCARAGGKL